MGRTKKPRKAYKPKPERMQVLMGENGQPMPILNKKPLTAASMAEFMDPLRAAFDKMRTGHLDETHWRVIANAMNLSEQLMKLGVGEQMMKEHALGAHAMRALAKRIAGTGKSTAYPGEIVATMEFVDLFDMQLRITTNGEMGKAVEAAGAEL